MVGLRAIALVALVACAGAETPQRRSLRALEERLHEVEDRQAGQRTEADLLAARVAALRADLRSIVHEMQLADADYEAATTAYQQARAEADRASADYADATRNFRVAEERYRGVATVLTIAAAWDSMQAVCGGHMTTQQYRAQLRSEGVDLEGMDIDHVWPHARGGADHPWNYQVLPSSLNRSLGASVWEKFQTAPIGVVQGFVTSAIARFAGC